MQEEEKRGKETRNLEESLEKKIELGRFLEENEDKFINCQLPEVLRELIKERKISKAELARRAQMSDIYLFQILDGRRKPSRDRLLCICFGLDCTLEETRNLLKISRHADLYVRDRKDAIVMYAFDKGWSLRECNEALYEAKEKTLI